MSSRKFVIDGKIEGKPESTYLRKKKVQKFQIYKSWVMGLSIGLGLMLILCFWLFWKINTLNESENAMRSEVQKAEFLIKKNRANEQTIDTLQKQLIRLKMENDYLIESGENLSGIFFEVQIGNFSNFNLDEYGKELKGLRQEKSGKTSKFCLGRFRSFQKAVLFENDIRKIGINSAFIIGRIDGKIVDYQVALKAYQQKEVN